MKKLMIIWGIVAVILVGTLTFIGLKFNESIKDYKAFENDMLEAANFYIEKNNIALDVNESIKLDLDMLVEKEFMNGNKVNDDECRGYVLVKRVLGDTKYKSFISCKNYTTVDYED